MLLCIFVANKLIIINHFKHIQSMKKVYLALMCMASLAMMTACGGKKADQADAVKENTEAVENADGQQADAEANADEQAVANPADAKPLDLAALYASGDFKPGQAVIFEDNLADEKDGEQPSKWDLKEGSVEVKECAGRNVLSLGGESSIIDPQLNGKSNFLTEVWNMEYEYFANDGQQHEIRFFKSDDEQIGYLRIWGDGMEYHFTKTDEENLDGNNTDLGNLIKKGWNHVAVGYKEGNVKIYINGKRLFNLPNVLQPYGFRLAGQEGHYFTNIRVTK